MDNPIDLTGMATSQVKQFVATVELLILDHQEAAAYKPGDIL